MMAATWGQRERARAHTEAEHSPLPRGNAPRAPEEEAVSQTMSWAEGSASPPTGGSGGQRGGGEPIPPTTTTNHSHHSHSHRIDECTMAGQDPAVYSTDDVRISNYCRS